MAQIGCYLTEEEAEELSKYAAGMQIARPNVCVLLIQLELRRPRLSPLKAAAPMPIVGGRTKRVTARIIDPSLKRAFDDHVKACGMKSDAAAAALFRAELEDRRLFNIFAWDTNRP